MLLALVLGFFAPRVETRSVGSRLGDDRLAVGAVPAADQPRLQGLSSYGLMTVLYSPTRTVADPAYQRVIANVERTLRANRRGPGRRSPSAGRVDLS